MSGSAYRLPSYATCTPEEAQEYLDLTEKGRWSLMLSELTWRDREPYLQRKGYRLRSRYGPGWKPSWLGTNRVPDFCEDSIRLIHDHVLDAVRSKDENLVSIKEVSTTTKEVEISQLLTTEEASRNPMNHCVPILDVFVDPVEPEKVLMVMPYLRPFNRPEFSAIGEVVDFMRQTLEGLCFIHSQGVAHRDCAAGNIMMDATPLYPERHHPVRLDYTPDAVFDAQHLSRIDHPVIYYFIDFGISSRFLEGERPDTLGTKGRDKSPPELSNDIPYNAFMLDIYIIGHLYEEEFLQKYFGLEFLSPLISSMLQYQPGRRPTAEEALRMFREICSGLNSTFLRWRLRSRTESAPERVVYDTVAVAREGFYHLKRLVTS